MDLPGGGRDPDDFDSDGAQAAAAPVGVAGHRRFRPPAPLDGTAARRWALVACWKLPVPPGRSAGAVWPRITACVHRGGRPQDGAILQAIRELRRQGWHRLVLVSPRSDDNTVRLSLAAKIRNFVVAQDEHQAAEHRGQEPRGTGRPDLSDREIQVVQFVANGHTIVRSATS